MPKDFLEADFSWPVNSPGGARINRSFEQLFQLFGGVQCSERLTNNGAGTTKSGIANAPWKCSHALSSHHQDRCAKP